VAVLAAGGGHFGYREKEAAEGEPALPVARSTISSPERSEASEGETI